MVENWLHWIKFKYTDSETQSSKNVVGKTLEEMPFLKWCFPHTRVWMADLQTGLFPEARLGRDIGGDTDQGASVGLVPCAYQMWKVHLLSKVVQEEPSMLFIPQVRKGRDWSRSRGDFIKKRESTEYLTFMKILRGDVQSQLRVWC